MSIDPTANPKPDRIGVDEEDFEKKSKDYSLTKEQMQTMMATTYACTQCKAESLGAQCSFRPTLAHAGEFCGFKTRAEKFFLMVNKTITLPDGKVQTIEVESDWTLRCKAKLRNGSICGGEMIPTNKAKKPMMFGPGMRKGSQV